MLGQRRRRWANIEPTYGLCVAGSPQKPNVVPMLIYRCVSVWYLLGWIIRQVIQLINVRGPCAQKNRAHEKSTWCHPFSRIRAWPVSNRTRSDVLRTRTWRRTRTRTHSRTRVTGKWMTCFTVIILAAQANTTHRHNAGPMLDLRLRRRPNIGPALGQCVVFAGSSPSKHETLMQSWLDYSLASQIN